MGTGKTIIPQERIENSIYLLREQKVMLDMDLAALYGVSTKALLQAVKRNKKRFPADFMFRLTKHEVTNLRSQFVTSSGWGGRRYPPYVFTEQGVAMLSSVLRSERAVLVNIEIMRTFARLRQILSSHEDLRQKVDQLEQKYDSKFRVVFDALRQLMTPPAQDKPSIGFKTDSSE